MLREVGGLGGGTRGVGANIGSGGGTRSRPHNGHESHKPGAPYFYIKHKEATPLHPEAQPWGDLCGGGGGWGHERRQGEMMEGVVRVEMDGRGE